MKGIMYSSVVLLGLCCFIGQGMHAFSIEDVIDCPYEDCDVETDKQKASDLGEVIKEESVSKAGDGNDDGIVVKLMEAFGINYTAETDQTATFYIKEVINWILAIMGLIALLSMIWGFYKMLLSKDSEEGYTSAKKIVLNAALAIFIIGISWFLVSWFFAIYQATLETTKPT